MPLRERWPCIAMSPGCGGKITRVYSRFWCVVTYKQPDSSRIPDTPLSAGKKQSCATVPFFGTTRKRHGSIARHRMCRSISRIDGKSNRLQISPKTPTEYSRIHSSTKQQQTQPSSACYRTPSEGPEAFKFYTRVAELRLSARHPPEVK